LNRKTANPQTDNTRRKTLTALGLTAWGYAVAPFHATAQTRASAADVHITPAQTEGPYYPTRPQDDSDSDLLVNGSLSTSVAAAQRLRLVGTVADNHGKPLEGGMVEIWQCDAQGRYHHPRDGDRADPAFQGFGRSFIDAQGAYRFLTMRPGQYPGRTPHIHVKVKLGKRTLLTTQLYVEGEASNATDGVWRALPTDADRQAVTMPFVAQRDGWQQARFDIVLAA
jgi:protocatechuate 3,4-dioxygenase, beta subunit